ncbi:MAG TPA: Rv3654c family TadE-like protein [Streptosporangiaceae bacterium]|jgi:secretion/DNA translocation related TadE-like protein|nr:Rv3654c family TadE-like protein [Streptosporangiaceae bacterium]
MRQRRLCRGRHDRGSGTVWVIALMALVWLVAMFAMSAGGVRAARHRALAAADLAALAAASHAMNGSVRACGVAATVARAAHARLMRCALRARIAGVKVAVTSQVIGLGSIKITAIARAGPVHPWWPPEDAAAMSPKPGTRSDVWYELQSSGVSPARQPLQLRPYGDHTGHRGGRGGDSTHEMRSFGRGRPACRRPSG